MEILKDNFNATLPLVKESIEKCDFMCFDLELTGLWFDRWSFIDSLEDRYWRWRDSARQFLPNQFGLCTFTWDADNNRYIARPFNFFLFRGSYKTVDPSFLSLSSSLKFLTEHKFDFNKWIYKGIPYLSKSQEDALLEQQTAKQNSATTEEVRDSVALSGPDKEFIDQIVTRVTAWLESGEGESLRLERMYNSYQRRIIYQELGKKFGEVLHIDAVAVPGNFNKLMEFKKLDQEQRRIYEEEKRKAQLDEIREAAGFKAVVDCMAESGKPILGHNMLLDCLHLFEQFRATLPESLQEFKQRFHSTFPQIFDTKTLGSTHSALTPLLQSTHLGDLHSTVSKSEEFKGTTAIHLEPEYSAYIDGDAYHEAGFDAYATGAVFVALANKIGCGSRIDFTHAELDSVRNRFFVMHYDGLLNLAGPDDVPDRKNVFYLRALTKEVKTNDLVDLFASVGKLRVKWTGDTTAFVIFTGEPGTPAVIDEVARSNILRLGSKFQIVDFARYNALQNGATDEANNNNNEGDARHGVKRKRSDEDEAQVEEEDARPAKKAKKEFPECILL